MSVQTASVAQLEHQIVYNDAELRGKLEFIAWKPNTPLAASYRARCQMLRTMIDQCRFEYRRRTGKDYPYTVPMMPAIVKVDASMVAKQKAADDWKQQAKRTKDLIELGFNDAKFLLSRVRAHYNTAHNSDMANFYFSHWVRIFGAANPKTLQILMQLTLPGIERMLRDARSAYASNDLREAHRKLSEAASEMKRAADILTDFENRIASGAGQAELVIKFYAAVAAGGVSSLGSGLTAAQQAGLAMTGEAANQATSLIAKGVHENISASEFAGAVFSIGLAGASAYQSEILKQTLAAIAPTLAQRIASKAVDRYLGDLAKVHPKLRKEVLSAVTEAVQTRIIQLGMAALSKAIGKVTSFPDEPDWNFWENVFTPLVGGDLSTVVNEAARNSEEYKAVTP